MHYAPMSMPARVSFFGELLIRLTASHGQLLETLPPLLPFVGGAEANVATGLARLGHATRMISTVPDNALGRAALQELRRWGVNTSSIDSGPGRMGLYFLTPGAIHRPSDILYDRAGSAFAISDYSQRNWSDLLQGSDWLHVSGVTAALGSNCASATLAAMTAARSIGVKVSYDCNYRPKLWGAWQADAPSIVRQLMSCADIVFGGRRDIELLTGQTFASEHHAAQSAFELFPRLQRLIGTRREQVSADHNRLTGLMLTRTANFESKTYDVQNIVDRIGGGDAFATGVFHGLLNEVGDAKMLDFGMAAACLKHAQHGDAGLAVREELESFLDGDSFDVRR